MAENRPLLSNAAKNKKKNTRMILAATGLAAFSATTLYLARQLPSSTTLSTAEHANTQGFWGGSGSDNVVPPGISYSSFQYGLEKCAASALAPAPKEAEYDPERTRNPRALANSSVLIKNGHIWLGDRYEDGDVLIQDGVIRQIGQGLSAAEGIKIIDAEGRVVTPGIVDMHSHMTVESFPGLEMLSDNNEMTTPNTPYVRVIDALNPSDPALRVVAGGGVTTSLILPGSGNLMGGEAAVIKLLPVSTVSGRDMLISRGVTDEETKWRYMKMACGENPKRYYGSQIRMPMTRMGENYLFRRWFEQARSLMRAQDDWCDAALRINKTLPESTPVNEFTRLTERYPEDLQLESLVALLRHQVKLNVHCYLPQDIESMVEHSLEFDFEIAAFHHALSAWRVPHVLKRAKTNITIATFADMWGYKTEAMEANVNAPKILSDAGIPVAFKSDHPVLNAQGLMHEAQKAYHYGFDEHKALAAVTSVPAKALALDHRIGSLKPGMDGDVVVWERHPLRLGARPRHVIIDGIELDYDQPSTATPADERSRLPPIPESKLKLEDHGLNNPTIMEDACAPDVDSFVLKNVSHIYIAPGESAQGYVVVENGKVTCIGNDCDRDHIEWPAGAPVFETNGAVVAPGIVSAGSPMGLVEISGEEVTQDGYVNHDIADPDLPEKITRAVDGLKFSGLRLQKAFKAGVTTAVSQPLVDYDGGPLAGVSVAFRTGVENTVLDDKDAVINSEAALHFRIAHPGKYTVSQQIAAIRDILVKNSKSRNVFGRAAQGEIPVVVETDDKDEIASIIQIKQDILPSTKFVILGGSESYLVASHLARVDIPVILMPARCYAVTWQSRHCLNGPPITRDTALDILLRRGVRVGLSSTDLENGDARNLIWEAGWNLAHNANMDDEQALGLVTWNVAHMFGLDATVTVGKPANFVAYNGNPFEFGTKVLMVYDGGHRGPLCNPVQT